MPSTFKFNRRFFLDCWGLLKPYWVSDEKQSAYALLAANILCLCAGVGTSVALNQFYKDFYDALQNFNQAAITHALFRFIIILCVMIIAYGYATYFNGLLSIRWRRYLTKHFLTAWQSHKNTMPTTKQLVDNPDQRIQEDLALFPDTTLTIFFSLFHSVLTLITFGIILWNLSTYLFWSALIYALLGTWVIGTLGKKLAGFDYQQQRCNADFRYLLMRARDDNTEVPFQSSFHPIYHNYLNIISIKKRLGFFTSGYNTASYILGLLLAIPLFLQKKIQFGGMAQISGAFSSVIGALSIIVNSYPLFADWRAVIARLAEFTRVLQQPGSDPVVKLTHEQYDNYSHHVL